MIRQRVKALDEPVSQQGAGVARQGKCGLGDLFNGYARIESLLPGIARNNNRRLTPRYAACGSPRSAALPLPYGEAAAHAERVS